MDAETFSLLRQVSRSFYLTLRVMPRTIRPQLTIAYLLARTSDTIADTRLVRASSRIEALQQLRARIIGSAPGANPHLEHLFEQEPGVPESMLLRRTEAILSDMLALPKWDQERVREVLDTIISGQLLDLERFLDAGPEKVIALETAAQLDDYTYRVAGSVGEFWTRMCCHRLYVAGQTDESRLRRQGIQFGKGLQLINILRDFPADLEQGRCYLPAEDLKRARVEPSELRDRSQRFRAEPVYRFYHDQAADNLEAGWDYTTSLPFSPMRVRLACAWPILIGMKTLQKLADTQAVFSGERVKISRREVRRLVARSLVLYPFPKVWRAQFRGPGKTANRVASTRTLGY